MSIVLRGLSRTAVTVLALGPLGSGEYSAGSSRRVSGGYRAAIAVVPQRTAGAGAAAADLVCQVPAR
jgi:hypothetical protein